MVGDEAEERQRAVRRHPAPLPPRGPVGAPHTERPNFEAEAPPAESPAERQRRFEDIAGRDRWAGWSFVPTHWSDVVRERNAPYDPKKDDANLRLSHVVSWVPPETTNWITKFGSKAAQIQSYGDRLVNRKISQLEQSMAASQGSSGNRFKYWLRHGLALAATIGALAFGAPWAVLPWAAVWVVGTYAAFHAWGVQQWRRTDNSRMMKAVRNDVRGRLHTKTNKGQHVARAALWTLFTCVNAPMALFEGVSRMWNTNRMWKRKNIIEKLRDQTRERVMAPRRQAEEMIRRTQWGPTIVIPENEQPSEVQYTRAFNKANKIPPPLYKKHRSERVVRRVPAAEHVPSVEVEDPGPDAPEAPPDADSSPRLG